MVMKLPIEPPPSNTGAENRSGPLRTLVDWLGVTIKTLPEEEVIAVLRSYVEGEWYDVGKGAKWYRRQFVGPGEARVLWDSTVAAAEGQVRIELTGDFCSALSESKMRGLLLWLANNGTASRVDIACDDTAKSVMPADLSEAQRRGEMVTHAQTWEWRDSGGPRGGTTFTVGKRGNRRYLRSYDKERESLGANVCVRHELELRDEDADRVLQKLITGDWGSVWAEEVVSFVDFRARWANSEIEKCPRMPWFAALVGAARKCRRYDAKPPRTFEECDDWLERQVAPVFAAVMERYGARAHTRMIELMVSGEERWQQKHRRIAGEAAA
jgi:hypothetical protein